MSNESAAQNDAATTEALASKAHETIDRFADRSARAESRIRDEADAAVKKVRETEKQARDAADKSAEQVMDYVKENPLMSAGIAFVAGALLSSFLRR